MKNCLSYTMKLLWAVLFLCSGITAHAITFHFWNGDSNPGSKRKVEMFGAGFGDACYTKYYTDGYYPGAGRDNLHINTGEIATYSYESPAEPTKAEVNHLVAGIHDYVPLCFRVTDLEGGDERFSDVLLLGDIRVAGTDEVHMIFSYTASYKARANDGALGFKTITTPFYFKDAQGTKYINVDYDIGESWETDVISFFQASAIRPDPGMNRPSHFECKDFNRNSNRDAQFIPFNLLFRPYLETKKIKKIYNLPFYATLGDPTTPKAYFMCFFKRDERYARDYKYYHVYGDNKDYYPIDHYVHSYAHQCLGTIRLHNVEGNYRADWEAKKEHMGTCPTNE